MKILKSLFERKPVVGIEVFAAPTPLGSDVQKTIVTLDEEELRKLVAQTDDHLGLAGAATSYFDANKNIVLAKGIPTCRRTLTDDEWTIFLGGRLSGKKWKAYRFQGSMVEYTIAVVLR